MKAALQIANNFVVETVRLPRFSPEYNWHGFTEVVQLEETAKQPTTSCLYKMINSPDG